MWLIFLGLSSSFRHLVFDLDGTLVDSSGDLVSAVNAALSAVGLPGLLRSVALGFVGEGTRRLVERSVIAAGGDGARSTDRAFAVFLDHYAGHLLDQTRPFEGIPEVLAELHGRSVRLSVLTNKQSGFSKRILAGLGLERYFAEILGADALPHPKPDPSGLERLIRESAASRGETLVVGDSTVDVRTARSARVASCAVTWGFVAREALAAAEPDWLIERPEELLERIPRI